jgi:hypothetical protein
MWPRTWLPRPSTTHAPRRLRGERHHHVRIVFRFLDGQPVVAEVFDELRVFADAPELERGLRGAQARIEFARWKERLDAHRAIRRRGDFA